MASHASPRYTHEYSAREGNAYSQKWVSLIHCLTQTYIDFLCTQVVNVGQKQWENIFSLPTTEFSEILKSGTKEVQHIIGSVNYHRNEFWRLKIGWNLTTIDLMSTNPSILVYTHGNFPFTHPLNFKLLVQINSPFTHLPDSVKEYNIGFDRML